MLDGGRLAEFKWCVVGEKRNRESERGGYGGDRRDGVVVAIWSIWRFWLVLDEMLEWGFSADNPTLAMLVCDLVTKNRVSEARGVLGRIESPDMGVFHGMMRGFLKQRRVGEMTKVF